MIVPEKLLHFIWQHQYFQHTNLITDDGENLHILHPGAYNTNQGPDFSDASIKVNEIKLVGNIEIHVNSSDWNLHKHEMDSNYNTVILHIVWNNNSQIKNFNGQNIPQLTISNLVPKWLLDRYSILMNTPDALPCASFLQYINPIIWTSWKERLTIERLEIKTSKILALYEESKNHWEEVLWWMLAKNFGLKLNDELFIQVAKSIPINILAKHKNQLFQIEALLMGQANLLNEDNSIIDDEYRFKLRKEYHYLKLKYDLKQIVLQPIFLRMRPSGFPTIRIAQLAMLIQQSTHLFSSIKETKDLKIIKNLLIVNTSFYWDNHYIFGKESILRQKQVGEEMADNILINTIVPILFAYAKYQQEDTIKERMMHWLTQINPEKNYILSSWMKEGISNENAFDSQGLIQLKKYYCDHKRCMDCAIGNSIITSAKNN